MRSIPCFFHHHCSVQHVEEFLEVFNQPQNCRTLFNTWKPILEALDRHYNINQREFGSFLNALANLIVAALPILCVDLHYCKEPIAYCSFTQRTPTPVCKANAVLVPVVDPVHGPILRVKAAKPLKAGNLVGLYKSRWWIQRLLNNFNGCQNLFFSRCSAL